jgi:hypothetical protein
MSFSPLPELAEDVAAVVIALAFLCRLTQMMSEGSNERRAS